MRRQRHAVYTTSRTPRYIVVWSVHWQIVETQVIAPMTDLAAAMASTIARLQGQGWKTESTADFGFTFICKDGDRRLLTITARDPDCGSLQSFNPFRAE